MIIFNQEKSTFHLKTAKTSYIMKIFDSGHLFHLYWGNSLNTNNLDYSIPRQNWYKELEKNYDTNEFQLEFYPQEFPGYGATDLRSPIIELEFADGSSTTDFKYVKHKIYSGKHKLDGLPATYTENNSEAQTLEITLSDTIKNIDAILSFTVFDNYNAITRSVKLINKSNHNIKIQRILSASLDFKESNFEILHLSGAWARECHIERMPLRKGTQSIESRRGASSHSQNPFIALVKPNVTENYGEVYAMSLVYSGNFLANIEVDMYYSCRMQIGINPFDFTWLLKPNSTFQTPEAVLVYSNDGITGMSHTYQNLYAKRLIRGNWRDKARPILINNWEATYFDFDEVKIKKIAQEASNFGIELFVLDDGWFGQRNSDDCSLGDWFVNENKLHGGLKKLVDDINSMGLKFGLWFEPEMICPVSELYKKHPDWCLHVKGRKRSTARHQLVLDLSRKDVCEYIIDSVSTILSNANIEYVKWDMNRNMNEIGSDLLAPENQREVAHRYILGLYYILEKITQKFPNILFESCASGGGRFDPGMLYYMPQTWTSDNTDAIERLKIQYGTSIVYPNIAMGCHVSAVPNHQVSRITPFSTRGVAAMCGNFGYELDLTKLNNQEKEQAKAQIKFYKMIRNLIQFGDFYRLQSPFNSNEVAWSFVAKDKSEAIVSFFRVLAQPNHPQVTIRAVGLEKNSIYQDERTGLTYGGDELMSVGINIPDDIFQGAIYDSLSNKALFAGMTNNSIKGDYSSFIWHFIKIK